MAQQRTSRIKPTWDPFTTTSTDFFIPKDPNVYNPTITERKVNEEGVIDGAAAVSAMSKFTNGSIAMASVTGTMKTSADINREETARAIDEANRKLLEEKAAQLRDVTFISRILYSLYVSSWTHHWWCPMTHFAMFPRLILPTPFTK